MAPPSKEEVAKSIAKSKFERDHVRRLFTRTIISLNTHINNKEHGKAVVDFNYLEEKYKRLNDIDKIIQDHLLDNFVEEEFAQEIDLSEEFKHKYFETKHVMDSILAASFRMKADSNVPTTSSTVHSLNLPKLEVTKFDDNPKHWLSFWNQFKKIHEASHLQEEDKFQYLLQSLKEGSSARSMVESFPPSAENYSKVIVQLKSRFARDDVLIQIYIREIVKLILEQKHSHLNMKQLYDKLTSNLMCLESLGVTKSKYETILYPLVESALPEFVLVAWNRSLKPKQLTPLLEFFNQEIESSESINMARSNFSNFSFPNSSDDTGRLLSPETNIPTAACMMSKVKTNKPGMNSDKNNCCLCGKSNHIIFQCNKANTMSLDKKNEAIKTSGCCYICLRKGHMANKCKAFVKCIVCQKRHNVILCPTVHNKENTMLVTRRTNETLLQTVVVNITYGNNTKKVRAVLDSGAQRSYVKSSVVKALKMKESGTESIGQILFGGESRPTKVHKCYELQVSDLNKSFTTKIIALGEANICGHLPKLRDHTIVQKLKDLNIVISDINFPENDIGLLIGSDYLGSIMTNNVVSFNDNLRGIETKLGWTIQGPINQIGGNYTNTSLCVLKKSQQDVSDLWNIELLGIQDPYKRQSKAAAHQEILISFNDNISVNDAGRYEVSLLWKEGCPEPGTNYDIARKRLDGTTKKLLHTGNLHNYNNIFQDWKTEGIITEMSNDNTKSGHYLAHHPVIKESSSTTRVRPVFDGSAKGQANLSLNDCLDKGINLIEMIPKLLILFRKGAYGVTADIAKAFLQLSMCKDDRNYLKFLWWKNLDRRDEIVVYQHNRVVFGINCSPFLLSAAIKFHLENCSEKYKNTAEKLKQSFYVDNCVTSFDTLDELNTFILQSREIMETAKFDLRGWITAPVNKNITQEVPVLGMIWNTQQDTIQCNMSKENTVPIKITKRYILSVAQQAFDPLGIISAVTIVPKQILQRVWEKKYDWDDEVSEELAQEFKQWQSSLHFLKNCEIPRRLSMTPLEQCDVSLHICCDASEKAFAACIYLRTQKNGNIALQIVMAKSRVAPAGKKMSLPRLELMSAVIASRLYKEVIDSGLLNQCEKYRVYFWTDSAVTLAWLKQRNQWKPFVSNRVKEIRDNTDINDWRHIPGELNPADLPSRGCNAKKFIESNWLKGPMWMRKPEKDWPVSKPSENNINKEMIKVEEKVQSAVNLDVVLPPFSSRLMHFSKYNQIVRVIAWILRMNPRRRRQIDLQNDISNDEYMYAERSLHILLQKESFTEQTLPKNINTQLDEDGIRRVNTRLNLCHETISFVKPILLPGRNEIVQRLVQQVHRKLKHAGTTTLLSSLRDSYWILNARRLVKKTVASCVTCKKQKAQHYRIPEAPLPVDRVENKTVFQTTGIDLAGPLYLRDKSKCWIVVFTCATYRAVHLELVESIATATFLMALRRFIARRGRVCTIYTDQGTNFQGAANLLKEVNWKEIQADTAIGPQPIKWRFLPPAAPWWGGWWERIIRLLKEMLRRILGKSSVTYIELSTLLCEIEAVVNNRPLTYVTTDDDALRPLTPMMFLHALPTTDTPDLDIIDSRNLNIRLQYMEKLRSDFRQRFKKEYLSLLISKDKCKAYFPAVGDIVLIETESSRLQWPLGIIKELVSGPDGMARVAKLKTATGEKTRACQRLFPLELSAATDGWLRSTTDKGIGEPEKIDLHSHSNCDLEAGVPRSSDETPQQVSSESQPSTAFTRLGRVVKMPRRFLD